MDDFILALGWVGVYAPLALGAVGSMVGVSRGGMAACGALLEVESGYGRFIGVSAMPSSQTIYGIVVMLTLNVGVTTENAPGIFAIGILAGIALLIILFGATAADWLVPLESDRRIKLELPERERYEMQWDDPCETAGTLVCKAYRERRKQ